MTATQALIPPAIRISGADRRAESVASAPNYRRNVLRAVHSILLRRAHLQLGHCEAGWLRIACVCGRHPVHCFHDLHALYVCPVSALP